MNNTPHCLVLRLAAPLQSWGSASEFNRRDTDGIPTKSGIAGLLAAAQGRRRQDPIEDLLGMCLAVRTDQAGTLLRDYHTVSTLDGSPLPKSERNKSGRQLPTSPKKFTHLTERFYLQDACFVAVIGLDDLELLKALAHAVTHPGYPLALGRRSCPPTQPFLLPHGENNNTLWPGTPEEVVAHVPWQGKPQRYQKITDTSISLAVTVDAEGTSLDSPKDATIDTRNDLPTSFDPRKRSFGTRRVVHYWVNAPVPEALIEEQTRPEHDPFDLLEVG
ncbi:MAG: type I-E CRISPR-associated protein Cas5/CasD [Actinomycetaceae bacterium]|nr:type I-E CRISPR-associated protein Cas5/CasD [Actinomycetaceae bacterium]